MLKSTQAAENARMYKATQEKAIAEKVKNYCENIIAPKIEQASKMGHNTCYLENKSYQTDRIKQYLAQYGYKVQITMNSIYIQWEE